MSLVKNQAENLQRFCGVSYGALDWAILLPILLEVATALLGQGCGKKTSAAALAARAVDSTDIEARAFLRTVVEQAALEFPENCRSTFARGQVRKALTDFLQAIGPEERELLFARPVDWAQGW